MSKDSILGDSPSGTRSGPADVVPGESRSRDPDRSDEPEPDLSVARDVPGDAERAFHRGRLYGLLALGFERPDAELQSAIEERAFRSDLVASARAVDGAVAERARAVAAAVEDAPPDKNEWVSLYGVEEGVTVSPYELTYMPGPLMTNVRKLADLSGFYEAFNLEIVPGKNDRRDHLCFLLEFLAQLAFREASLRSHGDEEGVAIVVDARRQFIEAHLGRWYWRFTDAVSQRDDGFYAALAELLAAVLEDEIDRLELDPDWVPDDPQVTEWTEDVFGDSGRGCGGCGVDPQGADGFAASDDDAAGPADPTFES